MMLLDGINFAQGAFNLAANAELHGRVTAFFGPSGAGKTTLLEIVAGLRRPQWGRLELDGRVLMNRAQGVFVPPERRRLGYVPQEGALFPHLGVRQNLLYGCPPEGTAAHALTLAQVAEFLEIDGLLDRPSVQGLSGGERQRVALGRALLSAPEMLLLDEPLAGLDEALKERVLPYLIRIRDELRIPMLLVTHAPAEVVALCDDALVFERGRIVAQGAPAELFERSPQPNYVLRR